MPIKFRAINTRKHKYEHLRRLEIPAEALPGSLAQCFRKCGKARCRCASGLGHPVWLLTYMVKGKKRVERIPEAWVEEVRRPGWIGKGIPGKAHRDSQRQCRTAGPVEAATAAVRKPLSPDKFKRYLLERLRLRGYFEQPGDGRPQPQIPAGVLLWSFVIGAVLRQNSFHSVEALAHSPTRQT